MKITVKITKDVLKRSMMCGTMSNLGAVGKNCAIALAVIDIFPDAIVGPQKIYPFGDYVNGDGNKIDLPWEAISFIFYFDDLKKTPEARLALPEFSFEIEVPHSVIEKIGIGEAYRVLSESKTLELVHP